MARERVLAAVALVLLAAACKRGSQSTPSGTLLCNWQYNDPLDPARTPHGPGTWVSEEVAWPIGDRVARFRFETEIGEMNALPGRQVGPRHIRIVVTDSAGSTISATCMDLPLSKAGSTGPTPSRVAAGCFLKAPHAPETSKFLEVDADGHVTAKSPPADVGR